MKIVWLPAARNDLLIIRDYLSRDNITIANLIIVTIIKASIIITDNPALGRAGRVKGTREYIFTDIPYIVPYRVRDNRVEILRVFHQSRKWPNEF